MAVVNWIIPGIRYRDNRRSLPEYFTFLNWSIWNHNYQDVIFVGLSWVTWSHIGYNYLHGAHLRTGCSCTRHRCHSLHDPDLMMVSSGGCWCKIRSLGGCGCLTIRDPDPPGPSAARAAQRSESRLGKLYCRGLEKLPFYICLIYIKHTKLEQ